MTLLNVCGLSHHYAHGGFSGKHQHQAVLNNVSLTLKSGETVALLGRSGCGKSTLARLLVGLESPSQGNISWRIGSRRISRTVLRGFTALMESCASPYVWGR